MSPYYWFLLIVVLAGGALLLVGTTEELGGRATQDVTLQLQADPSVTCISDPGWDQASSSVTPPICRYPYGSTWPGDEE